MSWTHLSDTQPRARKTYPCRVCLENIEVGEKHVARRGVGDEGPVTIRFHDECERITKSWDLMTWETHCPGDCTRQEVREALERRDLVLEHKSLFGSPFGGLVQIDESKGDTDGNDV